MSLTNIRFLEAQPEADLPPFIRLANVGLATTAKLPLTKGSLPVKMFSYMACARPVLLAVDGEARELVEAAKAGLYIAPEDGTALAETIIELMHNPTLCNTLAENGRRFVEAYYSRKNQSRQLARLLGEVVKERC
jgi:glycosyltransferase involved in cell wall biosynthesis